MPDIKKMLCEGDYAGALEAAESGLAADPGDADLWNLKGAALRSMGRVSEAERCFAESLRLDPRDRHSS